MAIQFPDSPTEGDQFTADNDVIYTYENGGWSGNSASGLEDVFVNISGDEMTGNLTVPSLNGGPRGGFLNHLMNGSFTVRQRMPVGTPTNYNDNDFVEDRWAISSDSATAVDGVEVTVQDSNSGPLNQRSVLRVRQGTSTAPTAKLIQPIELNTKGDQFPYQVGTKWTLSFWYSGATDYTTESCRVVFREASGNTTNQLIAAPNAVGVVAQTDGNWNKYAFTFTIDGDMSTATGQADFTCLDVILNNFDITSTSIFTGVQFEPGPVATPFEHRPIATELALCQRYFFANDNLIVGTISNTSAGNTSRSVSMLRPVPMRTIPSEFIPVPTGGSFNSSNPSPSTIRISFTVNNSNNQAGLGATYTANAEMTSSTPTATYTYEWTSAEQEGLRRTDAAGKVTFVPADPANRDYAEFLASGATAADYVAPPAPPEPTTEEKVNRLLSDYDLTRDEMRAALATKK